MKHLLSNVLPLALCALALAACSSDRKGGRDGNVSMESAVFEDSASLIQPQYAQGFTVRYLEDGVRLVEVRDPQKGASEDDDRMPIGYSFALVPRGSKAQVPEGYERVEVPIRRTIVMTALQLSNFTALQAHDVITGLTGTKNLYDRDILTRVEEGRIQKIGMEGNFDPELILAAQPEVIFISPFKRGGYDAIKETGITLIPHLGYKELTPLGQAEWVKFVGMFIGREREANDVFEGIASRYNALKARVDSLLQGDEASTTGDEPLTPHLSPLTPNNRPTVFSGEMHGGNWYAVGGRNHLAQLFRDAGADYIMHDDNTGGVNMDYEALYAAAAEADYWRILNSYHGDFSYEALRASEPRNALFRAYRERHVIYCNMRQTPYYEAAPVEPDALLADLVAIFHPALLPGHEPRFYRLLK